MAAARYMLDGRMRTGGLLSVDQFCVIVPPLSTQRRPSTARSIVFRAPCPGWAAMKEEIQIAACGALRGRGVAVESDVCALTVW